MAVLVGVQSALLRRSRVGLRPTTLAPERPFKTTDMNGRESREGGRSQTRADPRAGTTRRALPHAKKSAVLGTSMTETRKLVAILATDAVGYSRLMGEDEAGTAQAVREHREAVTPLVAGKGGRIVKTTGDGLLIEFPSVVAAVECAIAIQKPMTERNAGTPEDKRIHYRIGVNLGDVLIEGDDILGDGVNIAARLEGICEPGGVIVSGAAYEHVRGRIKAHFLDLGKKDLKKCRPASAGLRNRDRVGRADVSPLCLRDERARPATPLNRGLAIRQYRRRSRAGVFLRRRHREFDDGPLAHERHGRDRPQHSVLL
jgi:class 3 adenylate cyclase